MEMNTRIQVEHPITEQVIDFDLIREQISSCSWCPYFREKLLAKLHSIECRINAEDPYKDLDLRQEKSQHFMRQEVMVYVWIHMYMLGIQFHQTTIL